MSFVAIVANANVAQYVYIYTYMLYYKKNFAFTIFAYNNDVHLRITRFLGANCKDKGRELILSLNRTYYIITLILVILSVTACDKGQESTQREY